MKKSNIKTVTCDSCNIHFNKRMYTDETKNSKNNYCSKECKNKHCKNIWTDEMKENLSKKFKGELNPNFNNKWSDIQKEKFSNKKTEQYKNNQELKNKVGVSNRGKKFPQYLIDKMHLNRTKESHHNYNKKLSDDVKTKIGLKSKQKFTNEFKIKFRETMVNRGYWFDNKQYEWNYYNRISNWIDPMFKYIFLPYDFNSVKLFNKTSNSKGYVRDHMLSRFNGYNLLIYPEILRHPANCMIIRHGENSSKRSKSNLTAFELFDRIKKYDNINYCWIEHDECLVLINLYEGGERWKTHL